MLILQFQGFPTTTFSSGLWSNFCFRSFSSSKTLALEDSILFWRLKKKEPIKSSLLSFLKASSEYEVVLKNSCSESRGCYLKQIIYLHMNPMTIKWYLIIIKNIWSTSAQIRLSTKTINHHWKNRFAVKIKYCSHLTPLTIKETSVSGERIGWMCQSLCEIRVGVEFIWEN